MGILRDIKVLYEETFKEKQNMNSLNETSRFLEVLGV